MKKEAPLPTTYEAAYAELSQLVAELQQPTVSIDELTQKSKRALTLLQWCKEKLRQAEDDTRALFE